MRFRLDALVETAGAGARAGRQVSLREGHGRQLSAPAAQQRSRIAA